MEAFRLPDGGEVIPRLPRGIGSLGSGGRGHFLRRRVPRTANPATTTMEKSDRPECRFSLGGGNGSEIVGTRVFEVSRSVTGAVRLPIGEGDTAILRNLYSGPR